MIRIGGWRVINRHETDSLIELCDYLRCTVGDPSQDEIRHGST